MRGGSGAVALVPGCGAGHEVMLLLEQCNYAHVYGLEISGTAAQV